MKIKGRMSLTTIYPSKGLGCDTTFLLLLLLFSFLPTSFICTFDTCLCIITHTQVLSMINLETFNFFWKKSSEHDTSYINIKVTTANTHRYKTNRTRNLLYKQQEKKTFSYQIHVKRLICQHTCHNCGHLHVSITVEECFIHHVVFTSVQSYTVGLASGYQFCKL